METIQCQTLALIRRRIISLFIMALFKVHSNASIIWIYLTKKYLFTQSFNINREIMV